MSTTSPPDQTVANSNANHDATRLNASGSAPFGTPIQQSTPPVATQSSGLSRVMIIDLVALAILTGFALYGFQTAFGGHRFLIAGVIGIVLGLGVATVGALKKWSTLVVTAATISVFFVFGTAAAVPGEGLFGVIPTLDSLSALVDGSIRGWKKLLTTLPPVGNAGSLLVVPYLSGLLATVIAGTIAHRSKRPFLAPVPIVLLLALSILFGIKEPASLLIQGVIFTGVALMWISYRHRISRLGNVSTSRRRRWVAITVVVVIASLAGMIVGEFVHERNDRERVIWRHNPEFDPAEFPSPLNSYRKYVEPSETETAKNLGGWRDKTLFTVTGLPKDRPIRLATMDAYDGVVFRVTQSNSSDADSAGYFQRVGSHIPSDNDGETVKIKFEIHDFTSVWIPDVDELVSITFDGPNAAVLTEEFRYNRATGTAASRVALQKGDSYEIEVRIPEVTPISEMSQMVPGPAISTSIQPVQPITDSVIEGGLPSCDPPAPSATAVTKFNTVFGCFRENGVFSNGPHVHPTVPSQSGHGEFRLRQLVTSQVPVGDEEQFAPLAALIANQFGLPARVVMGFKPTGSGDTPVEVTGEDVRAWIEVQLQDPELGARSAVWVPVDDIRPELDELPPEQPVGPDSSQTNVPPPPPPTIPPEEEDEVKPEDSNCEDLEGAGTGEQLAAGAEVDPDCEDPDDPNPLLAIPGWLIRAVAIAAAPFGFILLVTLAIAGIKALRRRFRRTRGTESRRVASTWDEIADLACDMGRPISVLSTRQEAARLLGSDAIVGFAQRTDARIFGPADLGSQTVDEQWTDLSVTTSTVLHQHSLFERWKVLVNPSSLRLGWARLRANRYNAKLAGRVNRDAPGSSSKS